MKSKRAKAIDVDAYITDFPTDTQALLKQLRTAIMKAAPGAEEVISYHMPAYRYNRMLVYFAGYKNHIGFYPGAAGIEAFKKELSIFKGAKGSVQFPLDKPLPIQLVVRIVAFRVKENLKRTAAKAKNKKHEE